MRPPIITWIAGFAMLGSALLLIVASGLEIYALEEITDGAVWAVLIIVSLLQIVGALFMPVAARWSTALCLLITMVSGAGAMAAGLMWGGEGLFGLAWPIFAGVACLGAAFLCFVAFPFVHIYRNDLEDLY